MSRTRKLLLAWTTILCCVGAFMLIPVSAMAANGHGFASSFGGQKSTVKDPEPLSDPTAVAVSEKTGEIYVIDAGHDRVVRFSSSGKPEGEFESPTGGFSSPNAIAVDNDPTSASYGDIYVSDSGDNAVDKFEPEGKYSGQQLTEAITGVSLTHLLGVAVDPSGILWVAEDEGGGVYQFLDAPTNDFTVREHEEQPFGIGTAGVAVDSQDNLYMVDSFIQKTLKFTPGMPSRSFAGLTANCSCGTGVAADPSTNDIYVDQGTSVAEYAPFGEPFEEPIEPAFGEGFLEGGAGIAVSDTHTVYVADAAANDIVVFNEGAKPTPPVTESPTTVEGTSATLKGKLEGGEATYHFAYNANGTCNEGKGTPVVAATGSENVAVQITGLIAKTKYTYCLIDKNTFGPESGSPVTFETKSSAPLTEMTSSVVKEVQANLEATVNPELEASTCVFQYGKSENYEHETPCQPGTLGEGETGVTVKGSIKGLEPATTYDYRVLATNGTGHQPGPNETFTTEVITPTEVETAQAIDVTSTSAVIGGQANPQGGASYYIEYGSPTCSLNGKPGYAWWLCASKSGEAGPLSGNGLQAVTPIEITGLTPGKTYSYWIVATNKNGSERGEEAKFTTPGATPVTPPPVAKIPAIMPATILPLPVVPTPTVSIAGASAKGNTVVVSIRTSVSGSITITGTGLSKITKTLAAGAHQLTVPLTKAGKKDAKRHKKITLRVVLAVGGKSASTSRTVKL